MSWRSILIASPAKLSLAQQHLHIAIGDEEIDVPLEDIAVIIIDNLQTLLTGQIISELAQRGIGVIICDERHLPCGELLPFHQHSRMRKALSFQLEMTEPFRKNCWRLIIHRKILNQAICLDLLWKPDGDSLRSLATGIRSGDPDNREAQAAQIFFSRIIPGITRRTPDPFNDALNYGYSVMRAAVARAFSAHGFLPALGLHHRNELNQFNLADDFVEVLRPLVDLWVSSNLGREEIFNSLHRQSLASLLSSDVSIDGERNTVLRSTEIMAASFFTACREKAPALIRLPELLPLSEHRYE